jgi:hypothetical protein
MSRHAEPFEQLRQQLRDQGPDTQAALQETTQAAQDWRNAQPAFIQHLRSFETYCRQHWSTASRAIRQAFSRLHTAAHRTARALRRLRVSRRAWEIRFDIVWLWVRVYRWYLIGIPLAIGYMLLIVALWASR